MPFPSTFAILRGAFIDAKSPAGVHGYEKPEYLVIMNANKDTSIPSRPFYRITRSNGGNADLDKNWPAKVGCFSDRIAWDSVMSDGGESRPPVKTKYCLLPLNVTFFHSNGMVDSCPVLSFERTFWMDRADKSMAHLSHREVSTEVVPTSLLWQSWTRAKMPLPAALKAAQDAFNGCCHKVEAVRRINVAYNHYTAGFRGNVARLEVPMSPIERTRALNLQEVALHELRADLNIVRTFLGTNSHLVSCGEFEMTCSLLGVASLTRRIRDLIGGYEHVANIAKKLVNDYACSVLGYPLDTFNDPFLNLELSAVSLLFQNHCARSVYEALDEIHHTYRVQQQHQQSQRDSEAFFAAQRARVDALEAADHQARLEAEEDEWHRQRQEEDERIEDAIEENRQEMLERAEEQMEAEDAAERAEAAGGADAQPPTSVPAQPSREDMLERVGDAAQDVRNAIMAYVRIRKEVKAPRDTNVPQVMGLWLKAPTADGKGIEECMEELVTDVEVRTGIDGCPWPFFVYENHVKAELAKNTECPITMVPLRSCKSVNVSMNCGHIYDSKAIVAWTNISGAANATCPSCRSPIAGMWQMSVRKLGGGGGSD